MNNNYNDNTDFDSEAAENRPLLLGAQSLQHQGADDPLNIELAATPTVEIAPISAASANTASVSYDSTNSSEPLDAQLQADLQNLSRGEIKDVMSLFTNLDDNSSSIPKKNEVIEDLLAYYTKLYDKMRSECGSNSPFVSRFSDIYYKLIALMQIKLKEKRNEPVATQRIMLHNIVLQAKSFLYKVYCKELLSYEKMVHGEAHISQMDKLMFQPFQTISGNVFTYTGNNNSSATSQNPQNGAPNYDAQSEPPNAYVTEEDTDDIINNYVQKKERANLSYGRRIFNLASYVFPWLKWIPEYRVGFFSNLRRDIIAGVTVASLLIPASMAYAILAGLPPVYGLYCSFMPIVMYILFAGSHHLQVGPTAMSSLMVLSAMSKFSPKNEQEYIDYTLLLAFIAGVLQLFLGIFRLGFIVNLLSNPVISGFTSAAAILVTASQLKHVLGLSIPESREFHVLIITLLRNLPKLHWITFAFSLFCTGVIIVLKFGCIKIRGKKYTLKWLPAPLTVVVLASIIILIIKASGAPLEDDGHHTTVAGITIVGTIKTGLPFIPRLLNFGLIESFDDFKDLIIAVIPIVLVGFLESISIAKYAANHFKYEVDANQEMFALGVANTAGSFFQAYPCFGSFARTAVGVSVNAKSQFTSLVVAIIVLLAMLFLTPLFYYLPKSALSAIIIVSVMGLIDIQEVIFTFKTKGKDCFLIIVTFILTLFLSTETGILIAVVISLGLVIFRSSRPRFVLLGRRPGTTHYSSLHWANSKSHLIQVPGVLIARLDSDLFFANVSYFRERINLFISMSQYSVHAFVMDCSSINQIDTSGIVELSALYKFLEEQGITLYVAQIKENVMRVLSLGGIHKTIPHENVFVSLHDAVLAAKEMVAKHYGNEKKLLIQQQQVSDPLLMAMPASNIGYQSDAASANV